MKFVPIASWVSFFLFILIFLTHIAGQSPPGAAVILALMTIVPVYIAVIIVWAIWRLIARGVSPVAKTVEDKTSDIISNNTIDNSYYAEAEQEIDENGVDKGL